jgi:hypothetical protein
VNATIDRIVKIADPRDTRRCVRIPAGCSWISRSNPIAAPRIAASSIRTARSTWRVRSIDGIPGV